MERTRDAAQAAILERGEAFTNEAWARVAAGEELSTEETAAEYIDLALRGCEAVGRPDLLPIALLAMAEGLEHVAAILRARAEPSVGKA